MIQVRAGETVTRERNTLDTRGNPTGTAAVAINDVVTWVISSTPSFDRRTSTLIERGFGVPAGSDVLVHDRLTRPDGSVWDVTAIDSGNVQPISGHDFGYFIVRSQSVV